MKIQNHAPLFRRSLAISLSGLLMAATRLSADQSLFADTFDRADSPAADGSGLNESTAGKSGSLGALTWTGKTALLNAGNIVDINGGRLRMDAFNTDGRNGGLAFISDHNFIDAAIKAAGSFKVSIDIASVSSAGEGRFIGFGIGQSLAELNGLTSASPSAYPSDVFIGYDDIGTARGIGVFHNGVNVTSPLLAFPDGATSRPDTLSAVFTFADMSAGTALDYEIFLDGLSVGTGSTTWGATDQNYLLVASTYSNPSTFDNFFVSVPGPPVIVTTVPADGATTVIPSSNLVATFDEAIALGAGGSVTLRNLTNPGDIVISLPGPDPDGTLVASGTELIIDPALDLIPGDEYVIEISAGTVADLSGNGFTGLLASDVPNWSFTADGTAPASTGMGPMAGAIGVQRGADLTLTFDESVLAVAGKFITVRLQDGTPVESIDASAAVISGGQVAIPVATDLGLGNTYHVTIEAGAFADLSGNPYAGIAGSGDWTFTTALADITYVDAVPGASGNTYATGGSPADTSWVGPDSASPSPTQWNQRAGVEANGEFLYQGASITTTPPELTTEITGLADGVYSVWGFYWDQVVDDAQNWILSAGLQSGSLTTFSSSGEPAVSGATSAGVRNAAALGFTSSVAVEAGFDGSVFLRNLFGVEIGHVVVSGGSTVKVFIGNNNTLGGNRRAWYDGVGHQLISTTVPADPRITSFGAVGGGVWELTLRGNANTAYEFHSSTTLDFTPGTRVENLTQGDPGDPGSIGGANNSVVTTDGAGNATVRMDLGPAPANFVRARTTP
jgi:hypothetical protein